MNIFLGFDPGGSGKFGWCVSTGDSDLPLSVRASGHASNALDAITRVEKHLYEGENVAGAGIDAPLAWPWTGGRNCDASLRTVLRDRGAPSPSGSVQHVNSLRGACAVQGVLLAVRLQESFQGIRVTESHPKAFLWITETDDAGKRDLERYISGTDQLSEHRRDSAIASLSAWAGVEEAEGWQDLTGLDPDCYSPVPGTSYWMPQWA